MSGASSWHGARACAYRINIEIVRWLVHEQQVAARAQQLRELHAVPLTARQVGHLWGKGEGRGAVVSTCMRFRSPPDLLGHLFLLVAAPEPKPRRVEHHGQSREIVP